MTASAKLKRTPLYDRHVALGARVVEFGGWEMPVQYSGIVDEHNAVRNAAGLFDISHMGEVEVKGRDALAFLQHIATQDVATITRANRTMRCCAGPMAGSWMISSSTICPMAIWWSSMHRTSRRISPGCSTTCAGFDVELTNISDRASMLALQGPLAEAILAKATDIDVADVPFHGVTTGMLLGDIPALIARTGYTGEDGFELFIDDDKVEQLWDGLLDVGQGRSAEALRPGRARQPALRGMSGAVWPRDRRRHQPLRGQAWLGGQARQEAHGFVGRATLQQIKQAGVQRKLAGFEVIGRGIARGGYEIRSLAGERIGEVTTGMPSPTLGKNLGLGYVPTALAAEGSEFDVIVRDRPVRARVVKTPFYKPRYKK